MFATEPQTQTEETPTPLADIIREETDDGRHIVRFLIDIMQGQIDDSKPCHRLDAARQLLNLGFHGAQAVIKSVPQSTNGRAPSRATSVSRFDQGIADIIKLETSDGRDAVRFLVDVMHGNLDNFKPCHRLACAKELLHRGFDNTHVASDDDDEHEEVEPHCVHQSEFVDPRTPEQRDPDNPNYVTPSPLLRHAEDDPFDFENYDMEQYWRDGWGGRLLRHIYGGKEAQNVADKAVSEHRGKTIGDEDHIPDRDYTPIENPEDDPYGKGHYGYKALCVKFGDNQAIRAANKAVTEYYRRKFRRFINENGSLTDLGDLASLDPRALQYLERSRHILTEKNGKPPKDPDPPSSITPERAQAPHVGAGFKPARGLTHPSTERDSEPSHVILSEAEGPPAPTPPPRQPPPNTYPGSPADDPPDDSPRDRRDPGEIRIPLRNLLSVSAGPL